MYFEELFVLHVGLGALLCSDNTGFMFSAKTEPISFWLSFANLVWHDDTHVNFKRVFEVKVCVKSLNKNIQILI